MKSSSPRNAPRGGSATRGSVEHVASGFSRSSSQGYSVGRWEGDTLVVESNGFNDKTWVSRRGLPHTEALRMVERYHRTDFGRLEIDVTSPILRE